MITCNVIDAGRIEFYYKDTLICTSTLHGTQIHPTEIAKRMAVMFHFAQGKWASMNASDGEIIDPIKKIQMEWVTDEDGPVYLKEKQLDVG